MFKDRSNCVLPLRTKINSLLTNLNMKLVELFLVPVNGKFLYKIVSSEKSLSPAPVNKEFKSEKVLKETFVNRENIDNSHNSEVSEKCIEISPQNNSENFQSKRISTKPFPLSLTDKRDNSKESAGTISGEMFGTTGDSSNNNRHQRMLSAETEKLLLASRERMQKVRSKLKSKIPNTTTSASSKFESPMPTSERRFEGKFNKDPTHKHPYKKNC